MTKDTNILLRALVELCLLVLAGFRERQRNNDADRAAVHLTQLWPLNPTPYERRAWELLTGHGSSEDVTQGCVLLAQALLADDQVQSTDDWETAIAGPPLKPHDVSVTTSEWVDFCEADWPVLHVGTFREFQNPNSDPMIVIEDNEDGDGDGDGK